MRKFILTAICLTTAIMAHAQQWATKKEIGNVKNLFQVSDSIFRSAQPDSSGFIALHHFGIASVLNLRTHHSDSMASGNTNFRLYHVEMEAKKFTDQEIIAALKALQQAPKPILIHCQHGSDRTGVVTAMYRIVVQHWKKEDAIAELEQGNFGFHKQYVNIPEYIRTVDIEKIRLAIK
ncbi:tyrosine phosphatase family protein [Chitinophaga dinghuensis]|uniref:Tyrosine phosphatase family protein n=1 Tax=Chitinophaga dinghuensis TaxID=1539050 RepID=A0A327VN96_9BACT|nr:dual specificity protein phosphatase family protein [Chitinophaga dinghuensis]RAJ75008.1 tyrosine phosphatase family protein [Chitinophaga dinghuensis]